MSEKEQYLEVGEYTITRHDDDYFIENNEGEGMQVFWLNFERLIDKFFREEF